MRERLVLAQRAISEGWDWLAGVTDHVGRLVTVVALVIGLPAGLALIALGWWAVAVGVAVLALLVFLEGAFRAWRELDQRVNTEFPRHMLVIDRPWSAEIAVADDYAPRVLFLPITFTNREPSRRLSLQFELFWTRSAQGQVVGPYKVGRYTPRAGRSPARCLRHLRLTRNRLS